MKQQPVRNSNRLLPCLALPRIALPGHAWPCLLLTPSPLPSFFETVSGLPSSRGESGRPEAGMVWSLSRRAVRSRNPHRSLCDKAAAPFSCRFTHLRKQTQNSPPPSLVLLQVPGCSSFGKSGPGCMVRRGREGHLQTAIWEDVLAPLIEAADAPAFCGQTCWRA